VAPPGALAAAGACPADPQAVMAMLAPSPAMAIAAAERMRFNEILLWSDVAGN
jgi:hypothetical protein